MFTKTDRQMFIKTDGPADVFGADGMTHNRCLRKQTDQQMFLSYTIETAGHIIETYARQAGATPGRFFCLAFNTPLYHY